MANPNKKIWESHGIQPVGHDTADRAMVLMLEAVKLAGAENTALAVFREAVYQLFELPERTSSFRKTHAWKPPLVDK